MTDGRCTLVGIPAGSGSSSGGSLLELIVEPDLRSHFSLGGGSGCALECALGTLQPPFVGTREELLQLVEELSKMVAAEYEARVGAWLASMAAAAQRANGTFGETGMPRTTHPITHRPSAPPPPDPCGAFN